MESLTSGTMAGTGSFRCSECGYMLTLAGNDFLSDCPRCGGREFERTSLFSALGLGRGRVGADASPAFGAGADADFGVGAGAGDDVGAGEVGGGAVGGAGGEIEADRETIDDDTIAQSAVSGGTLSRVEPIDGDAWLARVRERLLADRESGEYLAYEESGELRTVPLTREWTRIGRSLAADVRFDDPTVSRRHALVVRQADGVRVLDDRSLNGVFVNGSRVEWKVLHDGDEIVVGRYRLRYLSLAPQRAATTDPGGTAVKEVAGA